VQYMHDFATRLERTSEFVDSQALAPEGRSSGTTVRGARRSPTVHSRRLASNSEVTSSSGQKILTRRSGSLPAFLWGAPAPSKSGR